MKELGTRKIGVDEIVVPDWAVRTVMFESELEDLANSIREHGQIEPIVVRPRGDGRYELVSGSRRLLALKRLGMTEVEAKVIECSDEEAIALSIEENLKRSEEHPFDIARKVSELYERTGKSLREISRLLGREKSWVEMMLKVHRIDEEAKKVLAPVVKDYTKLYEVYKVEDPEKQRILAGYLAKYNLSRGDLENLVKVAKGMTVERFRNYCESLFRREARVRGAEAEGVGASDMSDAHQVKAPQGEGSGGTSVSSMLDTHQAQVPVNAQGAQTVASGTGTVEMRECYICADEKPRQELKFYPICRDRHPDVQELMRELRRSASVDSSHALEAAIALFRYLKRFPPETQQEVSGKALRVIEAIRPLDVEMLEELVKEVERRYAATQD